MSPLKRPRYLMPAFIEQALNEKGLFEAYRQRPAYQQNDYIGWITRAKREETKQKRLKQMLEELAAGDKYMNMVYKSTSSNVKHLKISVTGKVQGVWFRDSAKRTAESLGLHGFARNEPDGSVFIEVEGEKAYLDTFLEWCHEGSRDAVVETVNSNLHNPIGHSGFEIF